MFGRLPRLPHGSSTRPRAPCGVDLAWGVNWAGREPHGAALSAAQAAVTDFCYTVYLVRLSTRMASMLRNERRAELGRFRVS